MKSDTDIYVSSGAFRTTDIDAIIRLCLDYGIHGLELSSGGINLEPKTLTYLERLVVGKKLSILIHNYFPAPKKSFVLNLAAMDADILQRSREHCRQAIRLCARLGSPFYSVHAGFCYHAIPQKLGEKQTDLPRIAKSAAYKIFTESIALLADYAANYHVDILIENNVLTTDNLIDSQNELMLGVTTADLIDCMKNFEGKNVFTLLDVGHLKISTNTLGLDPAKELNTIAPYVKAIHLSDNDALRDSNKKINKESWFWPNIKHIRKTVKYILEVRDLTPEEIQKQLDIAISRIRVSVA